MRTRSVLTLLLITAIATSFSLSAAEARIPAPPGVPGVLIPPGLPGSSVNVQVNGYLPAPPGVNVQIEAGRPYYVERDRRIYIERDGSARHHENRHYKKGKKHHEDRGHRYGHDKHGGHHG